MPMQTDYRQAIRDHIVDVFELKGRVVGVVELHVADNSLVLENLAIAPEVQGFGLGQKALDHAEATARALKKSALRLYTNQAFQSNLAFYRRKRFVETHEEMLPDGGVLVHFERSLDAPPRSRGTAYPLITEEQ